MLFFFVVFIWSASRLLVEIAVAKVVGGEVVEERHSVPVRQQRRQTGAALIFLCTGQLG